MEGHERIAFDATTTIDRRDFGMSWTPIVGDAAVIGNDVEITIALEAVRVH
jgi:polyisoprenoid-binding protein YceI